MIRTASIQKLKSRSPSQELEPMEDCAHDSLPPMLLLVRPPFRALIWRLLTALTWHNTLSGLPALHSPPLVSFGLPVCIL